MKITVEFNLPEDRKDYSTYIDSKVNENIVNSYIRLLQNRIENEPSTEMKRYYQQVLNDFFNVIKEETTA